MLYHCGMPLREWYNLPIGLREFLFDQLIQQKQREAEAAEGKNKDKGENNLPFDDSELPADIKDRIET